jgi:hypothetical protein
LKSCGDDPEPSAVIQEKAVCFVRCSRIDAAFRLVAKLSAVKG